MIAYESEHVRRDGSTFPVAVELLATLYGEPREPRWLTWIDDLTERRRAEEEAARHAAGLARSNADLDRFAAVVAHDLQSPLRVIIGSARILERRADRAPHRRGARAGHADRQRRAARGRARGRHPRLLGRARRRAGRGRAPVPRGRRRGRGGHGDRARGGGRDGRDRRAPGRLRRPRRARAAGPEPACERPEVPRARRCPSSSSPPSRSRGGDWRITVADNGIGIEPGVRASASSASASGCTREDAIPGTGIGLAVCKTRGRAPRRAHLGRARSGAAAARSASRCRRRVAEARGAQGLDQRERLLVRARRREQGVELPARRRPESGRFATPGSRSRASSRGVSVTAIPAAAIARTASGSRMTSTSRGSKPAARQASTTSPSRDGAIQGSSRSS